MSFGDLPLRYLEGSIVRTGEFHHKRSIICRKFKPTHVFSQLLEVNPKRSSFVSFVFLFLISFSTNSVVCVCLFWVHF